MSEKIPAEKVPWQLLTLSPPITTKVPYANSLDPDGTQINSASHLDPSCLTLRQHPCIQTILVFEYTKCWAILTIEHQFVLPSTVRCEQFVVSEKLSAEKVPWKDSHKYISRKLSLTQPPVRTGPLTLSPPNKLSGGENNAENSERSFLQYFQHACNDHLSEIQCHLSTKLWLTVSNYSSVITLSLPNKLSSAKFLVCFNLQSASMSLKVVENIVEVSNSLYQGETPSYSASHPDLSCIHIAL